MNQPLLRDNTARPALEQIKAQDHELHAARVVQMLANLDPNDVSAIIGIATERLRSIADHNKAPKVQPKYLVHKREEAMLEGWRQRPDGAEPRVRVIPFNEVVFKTGDWRPTDELPEFHLRRIRAQREYDLEQARATAEATRRNEELQRASQIIAMPDEPLVEEPEAPKSSAQVWPLDVGQADKASLTAWLTAKTGQRPDGRQSLDQLRAQANALMAA